MKKFLFLLAVILGVGMNLNAQSTTAKGVITISAKNFKTMADSGKYPIIDIRTAREFEAGHIKGAINIDFYKKEFYMKMSEYKNKPFIYYCRSGNRTGQAQRKFNELKYKEGYELGRGIISWKRDGFVFVN
jgi:rhodanese-related sulfurtransferase